MRIYIAYVVVFLIVGEAGAMSPKSALKKLQKRYDKVETMQADFRELFEWAMTGESNVRNGTLVIASENRFRIETDDQLIVSDGNAIFRHNLISSQVIIEPIDGNEGALLPQRLLLNFGKEFKADKFFEMAVSQQNGFRLELKPKEPEAALVDMITIWATIEELTVHRLKVRDLNGNSTAYFLSQIKMDQPLEPSVFKFSIPEGAELFDLR
jgi:outer membrane lipoprotein carrier protein